MTGDSRTRQTAARRTRRTAPAAAEGVGARVRELRRAAGLTQAELAAPRFSKEYVSQVELGKSRPSEAALEWFAERLATTRADLVGGSQAQAHEACEAAVVRAEAEIEAHRHATAVDQLTGLAPAIPAEGADRLRLRHRLALGWGLHFMGRLGEALAALDEARVLAHGCGEPKLESLALYRMGVVRFKMGSLATSLSLLDEAFRIADELDEPSDALRARILSTRAKIRRRQKDFTAAAEDVELAIELARSLDDERVLAETYLDASLVAERRHQYSLAREYAERSKALFERLSDQQYVGKLLNNLGVLRVITGRPELAVPLLHESFRIAVDQDNRVDAAFAASSLASARLRIGDLAGAVESAERAIELLGDRDEYRQEEGNARLLMGRAYLAEGRLEDAEAAFRRAAACFRAVESVSHLAGAWVALGDVAAKQGRAAAAAALYRRAAEVLQDVRW